MYLVILANFPKSLVATGNGLLEGSGPKSGLRYAAIEEAPTASKTYSVSTAITSGIRNA